MAVPKAEPVADQGMIHMTGVQHFAPLQGANHMPHGNNIGDGQFGDFLKSFLNWLAYSRLYIAHLAVGQLIH